jgi:tungstate transport system ATP-binding protein
MTPVYQLDDVRQTNSDSFVLEIESLTVELGESLCLVAPTGAGKTTLLRLLSCLEPPTSGRLAFCGAVIGSAEATLEELRRIAMVHQRPLLLSESVRSNVEYGLRVRAAPASSQRLDSILEALGLGPLADQDAQTLSGGQVQLVALARALVIEPEVLLLDEPTAHLDPASVALVEKVIQHQKDRTGMTIVWATHNLFQARRVASHAALLLSGKLVEVADAKTFFDSPVDPRTSDFVQGKMVY